MFAGEFSREVSNAAPSFSTESTYKPPQSLGEYSIDPYPLKSIASVAKRKEAAYHTRRSCPDASLLFLNKKAGRGTRPFVAASA